MIRKYIIEADDSIKGFDEEIARLEREWGAEEIEPCEDCIRREAVITKIEDEDRLSFMGVFCDHDAAMGFRETIKELPSVTSSRPRGKWIYSKYHTWICSVCGENTLKYTGVVPSEEKMKKRWRYCSICGAEMEGAE